MQTKATLENDEIRLARLTRRYATLGACLDRATFVERPIHCVQLVADRHALRLEIAVIRERLRTCVAYLDVA